MNYAFGVERYLPIFPTVPTAITKKCRKKFDLPNSFFIRVHRQALLLKAQTLCFQYLGFHDHTFNRAKLANYVISPGFHKQAFHGQAAEFSCPGFHDKQQNSLPMHCNVLLEEEFPEV